MENLAILLEQKQKAMLRFVRELKKVLAVSPEQFRDDFLHVRTAERDLELLIELASDILALIFSAQKIPPIASYRDVFTRAIQEHIIPSDLGGGLIKLSSLRNRLVHEYDEEYDPELAYEGFRTAPNVFDEFGKVIFTYLESLT